MTFLWLLGCSTPKKCSIEVESGTYQAQVTVNNETIDEINVSFTGESRQVPVVSNDIWIWSLPALESIAIQAFADNQLRCETVFETNNAKPELPQIMVGEINGSPSWHGLLGTTMGEAPAVWTLDPNGRFRWATPITEERIVSDIHARDGEVWHNSANTDAQEADSRLVKRHWDTTESEQIETPFGHHVFHLHSDGRIAQLEVEIRKWFNPQTQVEEEVAGDRISILFPDGNNETLFSVWDHLQPSLNPHWDSGFYGPVKDWSHANSLSFNAERNSYTVALANLDQIIEIDANSGEILLSIDAQGWFFTFDSPVFHYPHDPRWVAEDQLMVFSHSQNEGTAVLYTVDANARTLDAVWHYSVPVSVGFLGQSIPLDNGHTLINFGGSGMLHEVDENGQIIWQAQTALGSWFGNVEVMKQWPDWNSAI